MSNENQKLAKAFENLSKLEREVMEELAGEALMNVLADMKQEEEGDFLVGVKACDLSGEATCEACQ